MPVSIYFKSLFNFSSLSFYGDLTPSLYTAAGGSASLLRTLTTSAGLTSSPPARTSSPGCFKLPMRLEGISTCLLPAILVVALLYWSTSSNDTFSISYPSSDYKQEVPAFFS